MTLEKNLLEPLWGTLPMEGVELVLGSDGYDVFRFDPKAVARYHSRVVLPIKMNDFLIAGSVQTESAEGGYIFTVMNPTENIIQLGVHLGPAVNVTRNISLYYTDVHQEQSPRESHQMAHFQIPRTSDVFRFAFKLLVDELIFYYECEEQESLQIHREPSELEFDQASILYIGQAGDKLKGNFEVSGVKIIKLSLGIRTCNNNYHSLSK